MLMELESLKWCLNELKEGREITWKDMFEKDKQLRQRWKFEDNMEWANDFWTKKNVYNYVY